MYKIKVSYQTGDSFGTEDVEMTLDFDWTDINVVTQNLKRIKEHYEMYQEMAESYHAPFKEMKKKYGKKDWFVDNNGNTWDPAGTASRSLCLYLDDGAKFNYSCPWCGYFETLYGAEIIGPFLEV